MINRRKFLLRSLLAAASVPFAGELLARREESAPSLSPASPPPGGPVVLSTWNHGLPANRKAWEILGSGGYALDAVEAGIRTAEEDPAVTSVGYGSYPDRDGNLTLDASIMDEKGNCGSVMFLEHIMNPISVARRVMEKTPHIFLAGDGALEFALDQGFEKVNLLTPEMKAEWKKWKAEQKAKLTGADNHDTIGLLAIDAQGNLCGGCSTSGLAWKMRGRVGDSPIIGAGLYCDNEVGGATATGKGEAVIKVCGSFLIVELMRQGKSPQEACEIAMDRLVRRNADYKEIQIGFLALNKKGEMGAFGLHPGFQFALSQNGQHQLTDAKMLLPSW